MAIEEEGERKVKKSSETNQYSFEHRKITIKPLKMKECLK